MSGRAAYFERRAGGYLDAGSRGLWGRVRAAEWAALRETLSPEPGLDVLDLGCGPGHYARLLRDEGARVRGVEESPSMLEAFRAQGFEGSLGALERYDDGRLYPRVLLAGVLEFCADPGAAFAAAARHLAPGGRVVCLVPAGGAAGLLYRAAHEWAGCPTYVRSPACYAALAASAGLRPRGALRATVMSRVLVFEAA